MFTKPLTSAPRDTLIKSFLLAIGWSSFHDLSHTFLKRLKLLWGEIASQKSFVFYRSLPWSQRFFLIFLREKDQEQVAKRRQRVAKATRRERKTSGYLGLESQFHADDRVRIWPSGVDWLIFFQTHKPIWLACLIVTTEGTLRIFTPHFWR